MLRRIAALSALVLAAAAPLQAQAYVYPALQPSRIAEREYNFALADMGDGFGTGLIFQWREGLGNPKLQFTLDAGFADPDAPNADARLLIGGGLAYQLTSATTDMPFDIVLAGGLGLTTGDDLTTLRVPFGAAIGHRFPLEGDIAITPFVHPRLSWDRASFNGNSNSDTNLNVDIGANFEFKPQMAIRVAAALGDDDAVALSFAWTPKGLRK
ncbi:MAG: hypothetical protein KA761_13420 [Gemmatimonadaceae bacterium]|nr:hypothetical protein [Gemmatimonadaceae bacterium]